MPTAQRIRRPADKHELREVYSGVRREYGRQASWKPRRGKNAVIVLEKYVGPWVRRRQVGANQQKAREDNRRCEATVRATARSTFFISIVRFATITRPCRVSLPRPMSTAAGTWWSYARRPCCPGRRAINMSMHVRFLPDRRHCGVQSGGRKAGFELAITVWNILLF